MAVDIKKGLTVALAVAALGFGTSLSTPANAQGESSGLINLNFNSQDFGSVNANRFLGFPSPSFTNSQPGTSFRSPLMGNTRTGGSTTGGLAGGVINTFNNTPNYNVNRLDDGAQTGYGDLVTERTIRYRRGDRTRRGGTGAQAQAQAQPRTVVRAQNTTTRTTRTTQTANETTAPVVQARTTSPGKAYSYVPPALASSGGGGGGLFGGGLGGLASGLGGLTSGLGGLTSGGLSSIGSNIGNYATNRATGYVNNQVSNVTGGAIRNVNSIGNIGRNIGNIGNNIGSIGNNLGNYATNRATGYVNNQVNNVTGGAIRNVNSIGNITNGLSNGFQGQTSDLADSFNDFSTNRAGDFANSQLSNVTGGVVSDFNSVENIAGSIDYSGMNTGAIMDDVNSYANRQVGNATDGLSSYQNLGNVAGTLNVDGRDVNFNESVGNIYQNTQRVRSMTDGFDPTQLTVPTVNTPRDVAGTVQRADSYYQGLTDGALAERF